jgi:hypothetical protein
MGDDRRGNALPTEVANLRKARQVSRNDRGGDGNPQRVDAEYASDPEGPDAVPALK